MTKLTYGADIELFVQTREGVIMPADTVLTHLSTKIAHEEVPLISMQIDGACLEYHLPICYGIEALTHYTRASIYHVHNYIKSYGCTVMAVPSANIREDLLERSRYGHEFGCKPDYNAYAPHHSRRLKACDYGNVRTAGGHLHIGVPDDCKLQPYNLVKVLDALITPGATSPRTSLFPAGTFRPTAYGIEYRVLDNSWCNGYSSEFNSLINTLHTLEVKWDKLQDLDEALECCTDVYATLLLLANNRCL